jgi:hypothetical protein
VASTNNPIEFKLVKAETAPLASDAKNQLDRYALVPKNSQRIAMPQQIELKLPIYLTIGKYCGHNGRRWIS